MNHLEGGTFSVPQFHQVAGLITSKFPQFHLAVEPSPLRLEEAIIHHLHEALAAVWGPLIGSGGTLVGGDPYEQPTTQPHNQPTHTLRKITVFETAN